MCVAAGVGVEVVPRDLRVEAHSGHLDEGVDGPQQSPSPRCIPP